MPYVIEIKRQARKKLKSLARPDRNRITESLVMLAANPDSNYLDIKPLAGTNFYRLRVGIWRVIYAKFDRLKIISIERLGARGDVYR